MKNTTKIELGFGPNFQEGILFCLQGIWYS